MNIHLQVSDAQERTLTLDGDLDLLDQMFAVIRVALDDRHSPVVSVVPRPIGSRTLKPMALTVPKSIDSTTPEPEALAAQRPQQSEALDDLSPIAKCYQIAAARGRALRLAREQASKATLEDPAKADEA